LKLIPFNETIADSEKIDQRVLLETFRSELPGIFNWAIEGLKAFQRDGLSDINVIRAAVKEFKEDQDILFEWLMDNCYIPQRDGLNEAAKLEDRTCPVSTLYNNYKFWAESNHEKVISTKKFSMEMAERGFKRFHTEKGNAFHGICIK
jgi:putative DNA primase/helicase